MNNIEWKQFLRIGLVYNGYFEIKIISRKWYNLAQRAIVNISIIQYINVREYRRGNQKWTIQRNWQHRYARRRESKHNTTQFVTQVTQEKNRISVCQRPHLDLDLLSCAGYWPQHRLRRYHSQVICKGKE